MNTAVSASEGRLVVGAGVGGTGRGVGVSRQGSRAPGGHVEGRQGVGISGNSTAGILCQYSSAKADLVSPALCFFSQAD